MGKSKYESHVLPNISRIAAWAQAGATSKEIAKKLGISYSAFRSYVEKGEKGDPAYTALNEAFKRACAVADNKVEAALYRRACGYQFEETTVEEKLDRDGIVHTLTKVVKRDIPPDPTSAMFWLTNRKPETWKYKREDKPDNGDGSESGVVELPAVQELTPPSTPPEAST